MSLPQQTTLLDDAVKREAERVFRHLAVDLITRNIPEFDVSQSYDFKCLELSPLSLALSVDGTSSSGPAAFPTNLQPIFSADTGQIVTFEERWTDETEREQQSQHSMSIRRAPDPRAFNRLLGNATNVPFLPAGFDDEEMEELLRFSNSAKNAVTAVPGSDESRNEERFLNFEELLDTPPGFTDPIDLSCFQLKTEQYFYAGDEAENGVGAEMGGGEDELLDVDAMLHDDNVVHCRHDQPVQTESDQKKVVIAAVGRVERVQQHDDVVEQETVHSDDVGADLRVLDEAFQKLGEVSVASVPCPSSAEGESGQTTEKSSENKYSFAKVLNVSKKVEKYEAMKDTLAKKYPFELDPFQQQAVMCMEQGSSVFVAAHTSAGKTVVAEYAVALCKMHRTRVIYTSPIKALSNQKFRDFRLQFGDVGLVTGDIQLHSDAFCLVMTTEILRSMLYNGSEVIRELEWCIFDEVHYINDAERGHVWEEVLIMLPAHVKIVMLSATVPNCAEFADWVGRIKNRNIFVIQTLKRPVPLEHYLYTGQDGKTKKDMFMILDKSGNFLTSGYQKAVEAKARKMDKLAEKAAGGGRGRGHAGTGTSGMGRGGGGGRGGGVGSGTQRWQNNNKNSKNVYINLIDHLKTQDLLPMVVFVFSRQRCDDNAQSLQSVDLTTADEKSAIHRFFNKCIDRLKGSDKMLPQVLLMQELCKRGFAVHHSGILPIVKEVVELLFQRGFVKILFATETFAMGVNMPARTVAFDTTEKFDGNQRRFLNPTEYVQMAGRAGRRGLDSTGTVIILAKGPEPPDIASLKSMLNGKPIRLESRFRLTYGMLLNLLRVEQLRIEDMLQRSYVECASLRMVVGRKEKLKEIDEKIAALPVLECVQCCPAAAEANNSSSSGAGIDGAGAVDAFSSIRLYFDTLLGYFDALANTWPLVVQRGREDKLFTPGRVVIIHYAPMAIVGRLAVVLKARFTDSGGQFLLTLFVPNSADKFSEVGQRNKVFDALSEQDKKWHRIGLLLSHAVLSGPEGIVPVRSFSREAPFTVLEDVGLDCLTMVCRRSIPKLDVEAVMEEHRRISGPYRTQSPDRVVRRLLVELETLSDRFQQQHRDLSELVYVLGQDIDRRDAELIDRLREVRELRAQLVADPVTLFPCLKCHQIGQHLRLLAQRCQLEEQKQRLAFETSSNSLLFSKEYTDRLKVLQAMQYIDRHNMVGLKGKVACEISNQELLITELILENKFYQRSPAEIAAMLSSMTCQFETKNQNRFQREDGTAADPQQNEQQPKMERVTKALLKELESDVLLAASRIDAVQKACGVVNSPITDELKFGLMEVVHQWAMGMEFADIMRLSEAQEGIIVRCIQRLDEVCKDVRKAARIVGEPALFEKMGETSAAIRRDIVFAASLYTTEE